METEVRTEAEVVRDVSSALADAAGWMKSFAIICIISGILQFLTLMGGFIGWLPILAGIILFQSASLAQEAKSASNADKLKKSFRKLKEFFVLIIVLVIINMFLYGT